MFIILDKFQLIRKFNPSTTDSLYRNLLWILHNNLFKNEFYFLGVLLLVQQYSARNNWLLLKVKSSNNEN